MLDIVIDGSYTEHTSDRIGCGVIVMDEFGFYTEHRFEIKHIAANSSFAEWYGLECALNMIRTKKIEIREDEEVNIYTDCQSIIDVMVNRKGVHMKNELLHNYILKVVMLYSSLQLDKDNRHTYKFHHIKKNRNKKQIVRLHKRAHEKAQDPKKHLRNPNRQPNEKTQTPKQDHAELPEQIYLQIKLEPVAKGHRKWVIYENHQLVYKGKLRTILSRYQKERSDISTLLGQKRIQTDKGTKRILKKYIGNV